MGSHIKVEAEIEVGVVTVKEAEKVAYWAVEAAAALLDPRGRPTGAGGAAAVVAAMAAAIMAREGCKTGAAVKAAAMTIKWVEAEKRAAVLLRRGIAID